MLNVRVYCTMVKQTDCIFCKMVIFSIKILGTRKKLKKYFVTPENCTGLTTLDQTLKTILYGIYTVSAYNYDSLQL